MKSVSRKFTDTQVPAKELLDHLLKLTMIDSGRAKRRGIIGHVFLPLKEFTTETEVKLFKMDLEKKVQENITTHSGELLVSLLYNETLNRLAVTVVEGRNLQVREIKKKTYVREPNFMGRCLSRTSILF